MAVIKTKSVENILKNYKYITIEPFASERPNGGYEKTGCSGAPEAPLTYPIASTDQTGEFRVITGVDQKAYEILRLPEDDKKARIEEIVKIVAYLKKEFGISESLLDAENFNFWHNDEMKIKVKRGQGLTFDIEGNYRDILKVFAIKYGGYPEIAPSFQEAQNRDKLNKKVTHYLYWKEEVDDLKANPRVENASLVARLHKMYEADPTQLFHLAVAMLPASKSYRNRTTSKVIFNDILNYLDGEEGNRSSVRKRVEEVKKFLEFDKETLVIRAMIKVGEYLRWIKKDKKDGEYIDTESGNMVGRSLEHAVEYFKNPLNFEVYNSLKDKVEEHWSKG